MVEKDTHTFFFGLTKAHHRFNPTQLLEWLQCELWTKRPWPGSDPGLVLDHQGLRLFSPGMKPQYWHPGMAHLRLKRSHDPLLDALQIGPNDHVIDCTLGMGHDSLLLSSAGARVTSIELCAPLLYFTNQGMHRYRPDLARRIHSIRGDYHNVLSKQPSNSVDAVYLDPMFAKSAKDLRGFTWSMMRSLGLSTERWLPMGLLESFRVARKTVLLKLSPLEQPPRVSGLPEPMLVGSRRVKFAKWTR